MTTQSNPTTISIKVSFEKSLDKIGLPLLVIQKNAYNLYFLLDTGANKNYIRRDFLDIPELNTDTEFLPDKEEFYVIDNVCHLTEACNFSFYLADLNYVETFQVIEDGSALTFPTTNGVPFHVVGILGTPFMIKHNTIINFATSEVIFNTTKVAKELYSII